MKRLVVHSLALAVLACAIQANAESLEEKKYWTKETNYVNQSLESANEQCGTSFSFSWVDKPTFRAKAKEDGHTPNGICTVVIEQTEMICRSGKDAQAAVRAKIKGFECGYAKKRNLGLRRGTVRYMGNNVQPNTHKWAKKWLLEHL